MVKKPSHATISLKALKNLHAQRGKETTEIYHTEAKISSYEKT
jgi:hypothetical protein